MKRKVNRIWDEAERQKHGQQVRERLTRDRDEKLSQARAAIGDLIEQGITVSQNEVARKTGISVGFVNKHLRGEVEQAKRRQRQTSQKPQTSVSLVSLEKENEHLRTSNQRLQQEVDKYRQINKELLAQVSRIVDLEDEVELLRSQNRELLAAWNASQSKVVSLAAGCQSNDVNSCVRAKTRKQIEAEVQALGIKLTSTLRNTINTASEETVLEAIQALKAALTKNDIRSPGGWLRSAILGNWSQEQALQRQDKTQYPDGFEQWYQDAVETNFVLDIPIKYLNLDERNEPKVKVNQPGAFGAPYRDMPWREAREEMLRPI